MNDKKILTNAWACFFVHAFIEIICFTILTHTFRLDTMTKIIVYMVFDMVAFYPQFLVGFVHEKFPKLDIPTISVIIMGIGIFILDYDTPNARSIAGLVLVALGNAFLHDCCAIQMTLNSKGKLFPAALFVAGGSFGVVIGQTLGRQDFWHKEYLCTVLLMMWFLLIYTNMSWLKKNYEYPRFTLVKQQRLNTFVVVVVAAYFVTFARSYLGYAIPISWRKETWQSFLLFFVMGIGKALGGYLVDRIGAKKVGVFSTLLSIPFLVFGEDLMVVSIIGVFFFSMTMSITFGMFLSVISKNPGVAFGLTTLALGNGIMIPFLIGPISKTVNIAIIVIMSLASSAILAYTLKDSDPVNS